MFSGVCAPVSYALSWCVWRVTPTDTLLDSFHDLTKPARQQLVRDILETADASFWAIDGRALTNPLQRVPPKDRLREKKPPPRYAWPEGNSL